MVGEFGGGFGEGGYGGEFSGGMGGRGVEPQRAVDAHAQQVYWAKHETESTEKIRQVLAAPLTSNGLEFEDVHLDEVVEYLRTEYGIEVLLDQSALDDLGLGSDEPVTASLRNISLKSALNLMLGRLELTCIISDEVLLITTQEEAEARLTVAVYPIADILSQTRDASYLVDTLMATIASETWAENGRGVAEIKEILGGVLLVSQTDEVHEQLAQALTAIRRAQHANE